MLKIFNFLKNNKDETGVRKTTDQGSQIVTRIAPSPTGVLHVGTARTALFNYLYAKQNNGKFIVRIEDTDKERSTKEFEKDILDSLEWLGLDHDEFYRQSERGEIYRKYIEKLTEEGKAYISKEEAKEEGQRSEVIRFKNPNKEIIFEDLVRGEISFDTTELGDFIIAKSVDEPLYHLAVVVDDHEMGVTHIFRGEDGISNTPRQILIQDAIGAQRPKYAHLPLILGPDKSKLSKRHGATSLNAFREQGYFKEAILNHLAFLGWNPGDEREIFSLEELIKDFDIKKVSKGGAVFNIEKLDWFNKHYLENLNDEEILKVAKERIKEKMKSSVADYNEEIISKLIPLIRERIEKFSDLDKLIEEGEFDYYFKEPILSEPEKLIWKKSDKEKTTQHLEKVKEIISENEEKNNPDEAKELLWNYAEEVGKGDVLWPTRYALSGRDKSPDPFTLISILGKEKTLQRIINAIDKLNGNN
ncbi:glutamate--tRNA ligase [Candidatus Parcubacteria bacterium]|nr:glutamate--tRNA ligase [Candidatus Parcubacteria bacterium]